MTVRDRWLLLGYALTYSIGTSAYIALSMASFARPYESWSVGHLLTHGGTTLLSAAVPASVFVLLTVLLDFLTSRRPQPLTAFSLGLAASATMLLTNQLFFERSMSTIRLVNTASTPLEEASEKGNGE